MRGAPRPPAAGARYAVLTTKHHDGYALWPSAHTSLGVADSGIDRDLVAEFVDACRAEGLRVGFYLSLSDWHHPDYPAFRDEDRPYQFIAYPRPEPDVWARYLDDLFGQLRELLTNYGEIDDALVRRRLGAQPGRSGGPRSSRP